MNAKQSHSQKLKKDRSNDSQAAVNNGFWDRPAEERAARMESACERGGVSNFFDLSPEERAAAYDR